MCAIHPDIDKDTECPVGILREHPSKTIQYRRLSAISSSRIFSLVDYASLRGPKSSPQVRTVGTRQDRRRVDEGRGKITEHRTSKASDRPVDGTPTTTESSPCRETHSQTGLAW